MLDQVDERKITWESCGIQPSSHNAVMLKGGDVIGEQVGYSKGSKWFVDDKECHPTSWRRRGMTIREMQLALERLSESHGDAELFVWEDYGCCYVGVHGISVTDNDVIEIG